jgi:hypothetical protein
LEIDRHQRLRSFGMGGRKAVEGCFDGVSKVAAGWVESAVEGATIDEPAQAFDQVQVGRVRREEQQRDPQLRCERLDRGVVLIAGVVQRERDGCDPKMRSCGSPLRLFLC